MEVKPFWPRQRRAASYQPVHLLVLEGSACLVQMGMANRVWSKPTGKLPETGRSRPVEQSKGVIVHVGCTWRRAEQSKDVVVHVGRHLETGGADQWSSRRVSSYMLGAPGDGQNSRRMSSYMLGGIWRRTKQTDGAVEGCHRTCWMHLETEGADRSRPDAETVVARKLSISHFCIFWL